MTPEGLPAVVFPAERRGDQDFMITFHPDDRDALEMTYGPAINRVFDHA